MKRLQSYSDQAYALLRIVSGGLFAFHGAQKLFGLLGGQRPPAGSQIWLGGVIEFFGGLAVALGIKTRSAAFLCSGTMAVAYFQFHWKFAFDSRFFPAVNEGELAAIYCFVFLLVACQGGRRWALTRD